MCNGIDECDIVIVCIDRRYIDKCAQPTNDNCKLELDYSWERKGIQNIIPLVMDPDCLNTKTWNGLVGAYLIKSLYISLIDDEFQNFNQLVNRIIEHSYN